MLRHLSYTTEERVCALCVTFVDLLVKTQSSNVVSFIIYIVDSWLVLYMCVCECVHKLHMLNHHHSEMRQCM